MCTVSVGPARLQDVFNRGPSNGGAHYATVLMYLADVEEGGETVSSHGLKRYCLLSSPTFSIRKHVQRFGLVHGLAVKSDNLQHTVTVTGCCNISSGMWLWLVQPTKALAVPLSAANTGGMRQLGGGGRGRGRQYGAQHSTQPVGGMTHGYHIRAPRWAIRTWALIIRLLRLMLLQFFPYIPAPGGGNDESFSDCARDYLAVKPKKGRGRS